MSPDRLYSGGCPPEPARLIADLLDTRRRTLAYVEGIGAEHWLGPMLPIVNPPLWEIGHLGWFQERWVLRHRAGAELGPSLRNDADVLYDSSAVPHRARWGLPLPDPRATLSYLADVLDRVLRRVETAAGDPTIAYFAELAIAHEDMHNEAFAYTCQTLGTPAPGDLLGPRPPEPAPDPAGGDVQFDGGRFALGAEPGAGFVFDNEKWAHTVEVAPFRIARRPVTYGEFRAFVDDGGYEDSRLWTEEGEGWRRASGARTPRYWRRTTNGWDRRLFDRWQPLPEDHPMVHVNAHEAEAWCRWAGRRLPTEAEWEYAAREGGGARRYPWGDAAPDLDRASLYGAAQAPADALARGDSPSGLRQMIGNVWEWTADRFLPYPGFVADPYRDYSEPWFGTHRVLRGGCYATAPRLIRNTWRNFYTADRGDVWAGFRTCAAGR